LPLFLTPSPFQIYNFPKILLIVNHKDFFNVIPTSKIFNKITPLIDYPDFNGKFLIIFLISFYSYFSFIDGEYNE